ncbi:hypothetical protein OG2516_12186 [Oceanicola granulosus HTCC2516]|uniref:Uncharacterized protein n=1 Tax=Oceanicola granulosus (strain ATCC BAA-861 / DSM 15982 / KCTC 12143 / HTCC2516) TaxID=314256 RepID=Q2CD71_OCEGH|nr:FGGY-family carbohydrate kinase [Oceanicola granulosus]EAR50607.1 hypothetical protein OG2516_12186 [Oceanicola granulosus HTCC2516]
MREGHVAVIDIGKTNAKVALVTPKRLAEVAVRTRPNVVLTDPPYPHFDIDGLWDFILDSLAALNREHPIGAISVTTHGASAVLLDAESGLAAPMLDYEHTGPDDLAEAYDALRPDFALTGSPRLPMGLNVGAQLHWLFETQPGLRERVAQVVTYPQFWSGRLTGGYSVEATSLGCHTDLWEPLAGRPSPLVAALGLEGKLPPLTRASDTVGTLRPELAARTGLSERTPVVSGIHDSNASLYPHLLRREPPFTIVSTGTWVICMSVGGAEVALDPERDTLINVAANGAPVRSARFMGGREYEIVRAGEERRPTPADGASVLARGIMLLPSVEPGSGPFPGRPARWSVDESALRPGERLAALSFYLALMTNTCLDLIGAEGDIVVEGPFGRNPLYQQMLAAATGRPVIGGGGSATGTSIGAAMLVAPGKNGQRAPAAVRGGDARMAAYADIWRAQVG